MPVFRFVRDLLGRKEEAPAATTVGLDELPAEIDAETARIRVRAGGACAAPQRDLREAVAELEAVLGRLASADWDPALHPKLEQISRTTLPAFVRAMESCLSRPLPEDPLEFYAAATALLRCAISALRGQGRYLRSVLPDEMKEVKAGVDAIGGAVNAMTSALGDEKRERAAVDALGERVERIAALEAEERDAARRMDLAAAGLAAVVDERAGAEAELAALNASPAATALRECQEETERLRGRARALEAAHRAQGEGLIQTLRRAERLVAKRGDKQAAARLHHLQATLGEPLSGGAPVAPTLPEGLAVVRDLVAAGEIATRDGDAAFEDPAAISAAMAARADEYAGLVAAIAALERECAASPVAQERDRLSGRLRQLDHRAAVLADERAGLARVVGQKTTERAALLAGVEEEVDAVFSGRVRLRPPTDNDIPSAEEP